MEPPSLLVVDDEENFLVLLKTALSPVGYRVTTAHDGIEALAHVEREKFRLAILDIRMHPMGGVEVLEQIKIRSPSTHVIMATAYPTKDNHDECIKLGAAAYLTKPVDIPELKALIEWIDKKLPEGSEQ